MDGGESASVTLSNDDLRELGFVEDGESVENYARVEHVGCSGFRIELVD